MAPNTHAFTHTHTHTHTLPPSEIIQDCVSLTLAHQGISLFISEFLESENPCQPLHTFYLQVHTNTHTHTHTHAHKHFHTAHICTEAKILLLIQYLIWFLHHSQCLLKKTLYINLLVSQSFICIDVYRCPDSHNILPSKNLFFQ